LTNISQTIYTQSQGKISKPKGNNAILIDNVSPASHTNNGSITQAALFGAALLQPSTQISSAAPVPDNFKSTDFRKNLEGIIITDEARPASAKLVKAILSEILTQNADNKILQEAITQDGHFSIDILDTKLVNAFYEKGINSLYSTTGLLARVEEAYTSTNKVHDVIAFLMLHEIGHAIAAQKKAELQNNFLNQNNTWEEDFADQTAMKLMHKAGYDIQAVLGIFGTLFGDAGDLKPIPFLDSHPHGSDRDLFLLQTYNQIYSRQSGEYISPLSNKPLAPEVSKEIAIKAKYDIDELESRAPRTLEEAYIVAARVISEKLPQLQDLTGVYLYRGTSASDLLAKARLLTGETENDLDNSISGFDSFLDICKAATMRHFFNEAELELFLKDPSNDYNGESVYPVTRKLSLDVLVKLASEINFEELDLQLTPYKIQREIPIIRGEMVHQFKELMGGQDPYTITNSEMNEVLEFFHKLTMGNSKLSLRFENNNGFLAEFEKYLELNRHKPDLINKVFRYMEGTSLNFLAAESSSVRSYFLNDFKLNSIALVSSSVFDSEFASKFPKQDLLDSLFQATDSDRIDFLLILIKNHTLELEDARSVVDYVKFIDVYNSDPGRHLLQSLSLSDIYYSSLNQPTRLMITQSDIERSASFELFNNRFKKASGDSDLVLNNLFTYINSTNEEGIANPAREIKKQDHSSDILTYMYFQKIISPELQLDGRGVDNLIEEIGLKLILIESSPVAGLRGVPLMAYQYFMSEKIFQKDQTLLMGNIEEEAIPVSKVGEIFLNEVEPKLKSFMHDDQSFKFLLSLVPSSLEIPLFEVYLKQQNIQNFDENSLLRFKDFLASNRKIDLSKSNNLSDILETPGLIFPEIGRTFSSVESANSIQNRDYPYYLYFNKNIDEFKQKSLASIVTWFEENWSEPNHYRDVVLNKIFSQNKEFKELDQETQLKIINFYDSEFKAIKLKEMYLDANLERALSLEDKVKIITDVLKEPSQERDLRLEKAFLSTGFFIEDYKKYEDLFLKNSFEAFKQDRSAHHGAGAALSFLIDRENGDLAKVRNNLMWLVGSRAELDDDSKEYFRERSIKPDQIKELFKDIKPLRDAVIQEVCVAKNGFFNNKEELNTLLDDLFADSLRPEKGTSKQVRDRNSLKIVVKEALYKVFDSQNEVKKLEIMNRMVDKLVKTPTLEFEDLVQTLLSAYGTVGVKFAQILSSQMEIKARFPVLYDKLSDLKDSNAPIPLDEFMQAIDTSPELKAQSIKVLDLRGSASIKCVYLTEINEDERMLKVRRMRADKSLGTEIDDFNYLIEALSPVLEKEFGIRNIPKYAERIFADIREEADLEIENTNMFKMNNLVIKEYNASRSADNVRFAISSVDSKYSNSVIMSETRALGDSFKNLKEAVVGAASRDEAEREVAFLEEEISKFFSYSADKFIHVDPHDGNIFINKDDKGNYEITLIDLGLAQEMNQSLPPELKALLQDKSFWKIINSITSQDLKLLASVSKFASIDDLMQNENISLTLLSKFVQASAVQQFTIAKTMDINPLVVQPALRKISQLKQKLETANLDGELGNLVKMLGDETVSKILEKSAGQSLKEVALILLNNLDQAENFPVSNKLWRFLFALSKSPYVVERIMQDPQLLTL
jgi:predicted unusual protein kinase regulating ubiquinone biosynthesis (AarF/ABC1/UbiB family)